VAIPNFHVLYAIVGPSDISAPLIVAKVVLGFNASNLRTR